MPVPTVILSHPRATRRGALTAGAIAALLALPPGASGEAAEPQAPVEAAAPAPCTATRLPTLGGTQGNALAVSPNGLAVGYAQDASGTPRPVLWQNGQAVRIDTGLTNAVPAGVNSRGEVVGTGVSAGGDEQVGWHWVGGRTTLLQAPAGSLAVPSAINDNGLVVGALSADDDGSANPTSGEAPERAAAWASATAPATVLASLPGDVGAHAYGVNDRGVVVGNSQALDHFTPVTWDAGGRVSALPSTGGWGVARSVDDAGVVVGDVAAAGGTTEATTWDVGRARRGHGSGGGRHGQGRGLVHGRAVGQVDVQGAGGVRRTQAVEWDAASGARPLPTLPGDPGSGVNGAVDATGLVAGFSADAREVRRPVTWTCAS